MIEEGVHEGVHDGLMVSPLWVGAPRGDRIDHEMIGKGQEGGADGVECVERLAYASRRESLRLLSHGAIIDDMRD